MPRKRPCRIGHHWFTPDPRIGDRQRVCASPQCQAERRKKTQASWRERNPEYFVARRLKARTALLSPPPASSPSAPPPPPLPPSPLRLPPPLDRLPWDIAQDEFGVQGADFLGIFGKVLLHAAQDQRRVQVPDSS
jgi:hypothetical protein